MQQDRRQPSTKDYFTSDVSFKFIFCIPDLTLFSIQWFIIKPKIQLTIL